MVDQKIGIPGVDLGYGGLRETVNTQTLQVVRSRIELAGDDYIAAGGVRVPQWKMEWKPLSFAYSDGGTEEGSVNLFSTEENYQQYQASPSRDLMVGKRSPLGVRSKAFADCGVAVAEDPSILDGLIFETIRVDTMLPGLARAIESESFSLELLSRVRIEAEKRTRRENARSKWDRLPLTKLDEYAPPASIPVFNRERRTGASVDEALGRGPEVTTLSEEEVIALVVTSLNGKRVGEEIVVLTSIPELAMEPYFSQIANGDLLKKVLLSGRLALMDGVFRVVGVA